ncbi:MAG: response regulator transcription factor [Actinomycetota bacterium]|nr:response regulator transcription factor [Actinomycetota bacterium]
MRIVIAEDSALFREGLASLLLDAGHDIVARVGDAVALVDAVRDHRPELAIVDIRMPPDNTDDGARAAMLLRELQPDLAIVLLSQHIETSHSVHLVSGGKFGYLLKDRVLDVDDFLDALRRVVAGGSALDPEVVSRLIGARSREAPLETMTSRERDVLALMAEGRTNVGIARRLWVSDRTVETHVANIMIKLGLDNTDEDHRRVLAVLQFLDQSR